MANICEHDNGVEYIEGATVCDMCGETLGYADERRTELPSASEREHRTQAVGKR